MGPHECDFSGTAAVQQQGIVLLPTSQDGVWSLVLHLVGADCKHVPHWWEILGQTSMVLLMTCVPEYGVFQVLLLTAGSPGFISGFAQNIF